MAAPITQAEIEFYSDALSEIKYRMEYATEKLAHVSEIIEFDSAVLQIRKSIELVVLATFAANRQVMTQVSTALHKKSWKDARKLLRENNPGYWPTPFRGAVDPNGKRSLQPLSEPFLTEAEMGGTWGFLSDLLHANNPFSSREIDQQRVDRVHEIAAKLRNLLGLHTVELSNRKHLLIAEMDAAPDGHVFVRVLDEI